MGAHLCILDELLCSCQDSGLAAGEDCALAVLCLAECQRVGLGKRLLLVQHHPGGAPGGAQGWRVCTGDSQMGPRRGSLHR